MPEAYSVRANKGEWSEFYVLLKLLTDKKLYAADENLQLIQDIFYPIIKIISAKGTDLEVEYSITAGSDDVIVFDKENNVSTTVNTALLNSKVAGIFNAIKVANETTFTIELADEIIEEYGCKRLRALNTQKSDINLVIHDRITGTEPEVGFSIKSQVGGASTLLNASGATNFIFEIKNVGNPEEFKSDVEVMRIADIFSKVESLNGSVEYVGMQNHTFEENLKKIDTIMPEIVAEMLRVYYSNRARTIKGISEELTEHNPLTAHNPAYGFKIKNLLMYTALGMMPSREWSGELEANGGYIVVRRDGEVVCYHIYNLDQFKGYLFNNTRLETASTTRHQFGKVYIEDGKLYIKLNLQIRFTS